MLNVEVLFSSQARCTPGDLPDSKIEFDLPRSVVSVDSEREREVREAASQARPIADGSRVVASDAVAKHATRERYVLPERLSACQQRMSPT